MIFIAFRRECPITFQTRSADLSPSHVLLKAGPDDIEAYTTVIGKGNKGLGNVLTVKHNGGRSLAGSCRASTGEIT